MCQPETMFTPKRPPETSSIVAAMRATIAGGSVSTAVEAIEPDARRDGASADISVKLSSPWSQNSVFPPKPCSLIIDSAKSKP